MYLHFFHALFITKVKHIRINDDYYLYYFCKNSCTVCNQLTSCHYVSFSSLNLWDLRYYFHDDDTNDLYIITDTKDISREVRNMYSAPGFRGILHMYNIHMYVHTTYMYICIYGTSFTCVRYFHISAETLGKIKLLGSGDRIKVYKGRLSVQFYQLYYPIYRIIQM